VIFKLTLGLHLCKPLLWLQAKARVATPKVGSSFLTNGSSKSNMVLMVKLKVKLMARGFTSTFGVNYNKTFAPIAKFVSIHCILAFATIEYMEIHQMNIKTTFSMMTLKQP
jgi:hypothetical protein